MPKSLGAARAKSLIKYYRSHTVGVYVCAIHVCPYIFPAMSVPCVPDSTHIHVCVQMHFLSGCLHVWRPCLGTYPASLLMLLALLSFFVFRLKKSSRPSHSCIVHALARHHQNMHFWTSSFLETLNQTGNILLRLVGSCPLHKTVQWTIQCLSHSVSEPIHPFLQHPNFGLSHVHKQRATKQSLDVSRK